MDKTDTYLGESIESIVDPQEQPLVSVIIPSYQRRKKLQEAIDSVLSQTFGDFEIIVVDDGSTPSLKSTVASFTDERIQYVRLNQNSGANVARNTGIEESSGAFLAFLDDDDRWKKTKLKRQVEKIRKTETIGVVYTGQEWVTDNGEKLRQETPTVSGDVLRYLFKGGSMPPFSCLLVRRSAVAKAGTPDPELPILQDREWLFRLAQHTQFEPVVQPLVQRRTGEYDNISGDFDALHDVTVPSLLEKYSEVASKEGIHIKFAFKAHMLRSLGGTALSNGDYHLARKYYLYSLIYWPLSAGTITRLVASIGGERFHHIMRIVRNRMNKLLSA